MNKYYLVEGETEKAFIAYLKAARFIDSGKIRVFNLMQETISDAHEFLSVRNTEFICIIDTDVITENTLACLAQNLRKLKQSASTKHVKLLMQNKNFEDELCRLLQCTKKELPQTVHSKGENLKSTKQKLAGMTPEDYDKLLKETAARIPVTYCAVPPKNFLKALNDRNLSALIADSKQILRKP